jgi:hypothetical protein
MSRPQWWRRKQFEAEGIRDADHARQLIGKMFRDARRLYPTETDSEIRRIISAKLGLSVRTISNWTR